VEPVNKMEMIYGEDGYYLRKENSLFKAVVKVDKNPEADPVKESLLFVAAKIPGNVFRTWQKFANEVARRAPGTWGSEAALLLFYHPEKKEWAAYPPEQKLSSAFVDFSGVTDAMKAFRDMNGKEWLLAGTFHSHPGGSSSPSGTDIKDEKDLDGIHIIVPNFGRDGNKNITIHACASRARFEFKKAGHVIDFAADGPEDFPDVWFSQLKKEGPDHGKKPATVTYYGGREWEWGKDFGREFVGWSNIKDVRKTLKKMDLKKKDIEYLVDNYEGLFDPMVEALDKIREAYGDLDKGAEHWRIKMIKDQIKEGAEKIAEAIAELSESLLKGRDEPSSGSEGATAEPTEGGRSHFEGHDVDMH
jgi:proteasome lid subunit RPN8/RPN11